MTLDEAIKHAEEAAEKNEKKAKSYPRPDRSVKGSGKRYNAYLKCAEEHRQLAEWLKELKQLREQVSRSENPNKLILVSERLPEIHNYMQEYIVAIKGNFIRTAFFTETNGKSWWSIDNVIAWMPLPTPPKMSEIQTGAEGNDAE